MRFWSSTVLSFPEHHMTAKRYVEVYILATAHKLRRGDPARIAAARVLRQPLHKARFARLRSKE